MNHAFRIAVVALLATLAGCESIGEGSTVKSIEIQSADGATTTGPFTLHHCLRDQLLAIATFTDGTRADFSYRVTWSSSDPAVVEVSNNDIPTQVVSAGVFTPFPTVPYRPGTVIPHQAAGTARITATFVGLSGSMDVNIATPEFHLAPIAPDVDPYAAPSTAFIGPSLQQRVGFLAKLPSGRTMTSSDLNSVGLLNPVLFRFFDPNDASNHGELDLADSSDVNDFDKYAMPNAATPTVVVGTNTGVVTGRAPENHVYQVEAVTSLCQDEAAFKPTTPVQVAAFADPPLTIAHEADFNGPGTTTGDLIGGSTELVRVVANLDTDGTAGTIEQVQDVSGLIDLQITHLTTCTSGATNCTCETDGTGCTKRFFTSTGNLVISLNNTDTATSSLVACYTDLDLLHTDDCEEDAAAAAVAKKSGALTLTNVPVDLTETGGGSFQIVPSAPAPQRAFTYPGRHFDTYVTANALAGFTFSGGATTGTQLANRSVIYVTRPQGSTTESATFGFVSNTGDSFWNELGNFVWFKDVTENTTADIYIVPVAPFASVPEPTTPVPFTSCPASAATC